MGKRGNDPGAEEIAGQTSGIGGTDIFGARKKIRCLPKVLASGESVPGPTSATLKGNAWLIVCTDRRVVFLDKGMLDGLRQTEIPPDSISSITQETGIVFGSIGITGAGLAGMTIKQITKASVGKFVRSVQEARRARLRSTAGILACQRPCGTAWE